MICIKTDIKWMPEYCDDCQWYECRPHPIKGWSDGCGLMMQCMDDDQPKEWIYDGNGRPKACPLIEIAEQTEPSLEQFRVGLEYHTDITHFGKTKGESVTTNKIEDEPQTNADQRTQCVESVETMSCQECKHWIFDDRWGWFCQLKSQDECHYEPKDEPQTCDDCDQEGRCDRGRAVDCPWK